MLGNGKDGESYVANVPGRGYCFVAPVTRNASTSQQAGSREPVASQALQDLPPKPGRLIGRDTVVNALAEHLAARRFVTPGARRDRHERRHRPCASAGRQLQRRRQISDFGSLWTPTLSWSPSRQRSLVVRPETPRLAWSKCVIGSSCWCSTIASMSEAVAGGRENPSLRAVGLHPGNKSGIWCGERVRDRTRSPEIPPEDLRDGSGIEKYCPASFMECGCGRLWDPISDADAEVIVCICRKLDGCPWQ
jgi:hypothetical protein